jgi:hypothetical protein
VANLLRPATSTQRDHEVTQARFARIEAPGFSYQITAEDVIWAARAATYEGLSSVGATLWAWTQRFTQPEMRGFATLGDMIQAHSQPVNPRWQREGIFCQPGQRGFRLLRPDGSHSCTEPTLERRARARVRPFSSLPANVQSTVLKWASARLANPVPRATDFAARWARVAPRFTRLYTVGGNAFYAEGGSEQWARGRVRMIEGSRVAGAAASGFAVLLAAAAAGVAIYYGTR